MVLFVDLNALLMFPSGTEDNAYPVLPLSTTILTPKSVNTVLLLAKSTMKDWELVPSDCFIFDNIIYQDVYDIFFFFNADFLHNQKR